MRTQKNKWVSIGILKSSFDKLKKLIVETGDPSVSEYVRVAIAMREKADREFLEIQNRPEQLEPPWREEG